jgi:hypothetical protein
MAPLGKPAMLDGDQDWGELGLIGAPGGWLGAALGSRGEGHPSRQVGGGVGRNRNV